MECQSTMKELKVSVFRILLQSKNHYARWRAKRIGPLGHEQPFYSPRNGTGLLSSSSSSSLSIWHHCDPSVFKAEQDWFDFTAGWFSNLVTRLERRKNILQKVPYSLSMVAWRYTRNPLVPVKRVLFLDVRAVLHIFVKIVGFCPLTRTWEMLRGYKYYGPCPRRNLILLFSNLIIQGQSFTGKKWFIVSILYKSVKLFFKGCRVS